MDHIVTRNISRDLAMRLRFENVEQFTTLVRMHLSFELDLHTEENEESFHEKGLFKKFNRFSKKTKPICTSTKSSNSPEQDRQVLSKELISKLGHIAEFLTKEENINQEGIFRRTGSVARQAELKHLLLGGKQPINLSSGEYTVHDCASVLKVILSDLPEPLLMDAFYSAYCQLAAQYNKAFQQQGDHCALEARLTNALQLLFLLLPVENRELLDCVLKMLYKTTEYTEKNLMNSDSLSTLFTPHLICPRKLPPEALHAISQQMCGLVSFMIRRSEVLFDVPPKLATDIKMYFVEQKRKRTMSPEMMLDESVTSDSTAATVFTFIDREKTQQAHDSNPTDQALAQLYAHIQSMPESSKKRKLVKQFNKENGHGTPLQHLMVNRMKQGLSKSSSLGDSIKRHIFSKGLLPKTPKRSHGSSSSSTSGGGGTPGSVSATPNRAQYSVTNNSSGLTPKKRVLFQTPLKPTDSLSKSSTATASSSSSSSSSSSCSTRPHPLHVINKSNCASTDCLMEETSLESVKGETEEENPLKSTVPRKKTTTQLRLQRKYPSEPNLKSCYFGLGGGGGADESDGGTGAEAITTANSSGMAHIAAAGKVGVSLWDLVTIARATQLCDESAAQSRERIYSLNGTQQSLLTDDERPSMSPITKSTRRMPKYMQESIMTPRSRKPVMLLGMTLNNTSTVSTLSDQNQSKLSFREEDEYSLDLQATRNDSDLMKVSSLETTAESSGSSDVSTECCPPSMIHTSIQDSMVATLVVPPPPIVTVVNPDSLTSTFRDYLFSRSVLTESPADLSFSSQPDDFGPNMDDIRELNESEMSESLLYCLDGNKPAGGKGEGESAAVDKENRTTNIGRKRTSEECEIKLGPEEERQIKKLVLHVQQDTTGVGETSL